MAKMRLTLFMLAVVGCFMVGSVSAYVHIVGGRFGWDQPDNKTFYEEWAKPRTFGVGDKLVFPFRTGVQNIIWVGKKEYFDRCYEGDALMWYHKGPTTIDLEETGEYYFFCNVGTHCENGQKLGITVVKGEGSSGTPFPFDLGFEDYYAADRLAATAAPPPVAVPVGAAQNTTKSSATSIRNVGMVSGLLTFLLSLFI